MKKKEISELAYKYLDSEITEGISTDSEKQMFVQGFMQGCSMILQSIKEPEEKCPFPLGGVPKECNIWQNSETGCFDCPLNGTATVK